MNRGESFAAIFRGMRTPDEHAEAARHRRECAPCAADLRAARQRVAEIAAGAAEVEAPPALRARILASAAAAPRLARFVDEVARMLDVSPQDARQYLARVDRPQGWTSTPFHGVDRMPIAGGPSTTGAVVHFVRVQPGAVVPRHEHLGRELGLLLQGRGCDAQGHVVGPGHQDDLPAGTAHSFEALPLVTSVMLVVAHEGIRFAGFEIRP